MKKFLVVTLSLIGGLLPVTSVWAVNQTSYCKEYAAYQQAALPFIATGAADLPDGSAEHPFRICTADQFYYVASNSGLWDRHFYLESDLDLTAYPNLMIGGCSGTKFSGLFDGNGFIIYNYKFDDLSSSCGGLFGVVNPVLTTAAAKA